MIIGEVAVDEEETGEHDRRSGNTQPVPVRRDKIGSLRIEDHEVTSSADEDSLEEHGRQQTVFTLPWEVFRHDHQGYERDVVKDAVADLHGLGRKRQRPVGVGGVGSCRVAD